MACQGMENRPPLCQTIPGIRVLRELALQHPRGLEQQAVGRPLVITQGRSGERQWTHMVWTGRSPSPVKSPPIQK